MGTVLFKVAYVFNFYHLPHILLIKDFDEIY